jgi:hypothetical protein
MVVGRGVAYQSCQRESRLARAPQARSIPEQAAAKQTQVFCFPPGVRRMSFQKKKAFLR